MLFARISFRFQAELMLLPTPVLYEFVILTLRISLAFLYYFVRVVMPVSCANGILSSVADKWTLAPGEQGEIVASMLSIICQLSSLTEVGRDSAGPATEALGATLSFSFAFSRSWVSFWCDFYKICFMEVFGFDLRSCCCWVATVAISNLPGLY